MIRINLKMQIKIRLMLLQFLNQLKLRNLKMLLNNLFKNKMKLNLSKSQKQNNSNSQALINDADGDISGDQVNHQENACFSGETTS